MDLLSRVFKKVAAISTLCGVMLFASQAHAADRNLNIGLVSFKTCVEQSKLGKQEQATFDSMKKQMESILGEKEKVLNDMATKFNDTDYLDSLAPAEETELKRKFRALSQEISQQQQQYYQTLNQANIRILQKISETITKAATDVAKEKRLDIVFNEESSFYHAPELDISNLVVTKMDEAFDREAKEAKDKAPADKK